ncbi:hypothetical protein [uncultured Ruegeria sp.]|uniref:hypothetical protein n=1 Tax=uncultured Ruegeria sp. TaxID=259304 RepID=UPI0026181584|nr:hypothetical protein [uncultured Ruegeria sp.]
MKARLSGLLAAGAILSGCATSIPMITQASEDLTPVQSCAIGYDMARTIHRSISLRDTVVIAANKTSDCEKHALRYLRLTGFAVDESGQKNARKALDIEVMDESDGAVTVVATVAGNLRIARSYRLAEQGVYASSAPSIVQLPSEYRKRWNIS